MGQSLRFLVFLLVSVFLGWRGDHVYKTDKDKNPNIVLIITDDLKPALGCYGDKFAKTPALDQIAGSSFIFLNNHSQQAVCSSARASLITGMRPDYIMVWNMNTPIRNMISNIVTMPQYFKENGYETAAIGKVFDPRSVDEFHDAVSWSVPYQGREQDIHESDDVNIAREILSIGAPNVADSQTPDGKILVKGLKQLDKFAGNEKPFFLAIGFSKPHLPFVAPKKYWDLYDRNKIEIPSCQEHAEGTPQWVYQTRWDLSKQYSDIPEKGVLSSDKQKELIHGYYACVSFIDQQIGTLINHLKKNGLYENTIVVICSDHGIHLGDHSIWCKQSNLEEITRSLMIISYGTRYVGKTKSPTELLDIFPSLCELAGIKSPEKLDGESLVQIMNGNKKSVKPYSVSQIQRLDNYMGYAFRDERYRYVVWLKDDFRSYMAYMKNLEVARELYDYKTDPFETVNHINDTEYTDVVQKFENWSVNFFIDQEKSHLQDNQFMNE